MRLTLSFWLCFSCVCQAQQQLTFQRYSTHDGLSNNYVFTIAEDRQRFIWIANAQGIDRFDGHTFRHYDVNDSTTIAAQFNTHVMIDYRGGIWALVNSTLFKYNLAKDHFEKKLQTEDKAFLNTNNKITRQFVVLNDTLGRCMWVVLRGSLFRYDIDKERLVATPLTRLQTPRVVMRISASTLIIATNDEWVAYELTTQKLYRTPKEKSNWVIRPYQTNSWIYTDASYQIKQMRYHGEGRFEAPRLLSQNPNKKEIVCIKFIASDAPDSVFWCGLVSRGLALMDAKDTYRGFNQRTNDANGLHFSTIQNIFQDSQKNIWLCTDKGIYRSNPFYFQASKKTYPFFKTLDINRTRQVLGCTINPDWEWVATSTFGLFLYDNVHQKIIKRFWWEGRNITQIKYDVAGNLWVLTNGALVQITPQLRTNTFSLESVKPKLTGWKFDFDDAQQVWIASEKGLVKYHLTTHQLATFVVTSSSQNPYIYDFVRHSPSTLALATDSGVAIFDTKIEKITKRIPHSKTIFGVTIDPQGQLWAVGSDQLLKIQNDRIVKSWKNYGYQKRLRLKNSIIIDKNSKIWLNTHDGLLNFDTKTEKFRLFTEDDGLVNNYAYGPIYENGDFYYLNHDEGVSFFAPLQPLLHLSNTQPLITDLFLLGRRQTIDFSKNDAPYTIRHAQNVVTFQFTAVDFRDADKLLFQHQLEGFDDDWQKASTLRQATYTNLKGGQYRFKVRVLGADGVPSNTIAQYPIEVTTPYYQAGWFYGFIVLSIAAFFYGLYRYRLSQILQLQEVRNSISRDLHDEVGSALSSISMLSTSTKAALDKDPARTKMLVEMIQTNAQKIMENMDDIVWTVSPDKDESQHIILRMQDYLNTLSEANQLSIHLTTEGEWEGLRLPMPVRRNLYLIFKEAVNNALKHAKATQLTVKLNRKPSELLLEVIDNGQGFDTTTSSLRNGLTNMRQRATDLNATLKIHSSTNGTQLALRIPFS
ncbi:MAG: histidine kinase [Spirosomaceae bacterium]|nr:histidine kinase [Spirosomataceae bacterium]